MTQSLKKPKSKPREKLTDKEQSERFSQAAAVVQTPEKLQEFEISLQTLLGKFRRQMKTGLDH